MKKLILFALFVCLTGCTTLEKLICKPEPVITPEVIKIDPKLIEPCKAIPLPSQADLASFDAVPQHLAKILAVYVDCRNKQDASIAVLKKFSNQP